MIIYQPDMSTRLEVRVESDTVWLTQAQMSDLFNKDRSVITRHISNVFSEQELDEKSNVHFLHIAHSDKPVKLYSLDVIISVGYRVKSLRGTQFRRWANGILKDYLIKGYAFSIHQTRDGDRIERRLLEHEKRLDNLTSKVDFFVRTALPPLEGVFADGQIFEAYTFVSSLIRSAKEQIVLIDNYIDESVLLLISKRQKGVSATIMTRRLSELQVMDLKRHNQQYPPVVVEETVLVHDRFLCVDETVYHLGASLKDLGKKLFAFSRMEVTTKKLKSLCR